MFKRVLVANRGEIAIRIARTAREMGIGVVGIHSEDDAKSPHLRACSAVQPLQGHGAASYLDSGQIIAAAVRHGCDAVHPGYGFLSESAGFAEDCADSGLAFIGPRPELVGLFSDKARARVFARTCGVPVLEGTDGAVDLEGLRAFAAGLGNGQPFLIKALAGGGGRGIRLVEHDADLEAAFARCQSEAQRSFGDGRVYAERYVARARHIEVQVVGDGNSVSHLWERDCTLQRANQKLIEFAPALGLSDALRGGLIDAACRIAAECRFDNVGTIEFLIDLDRWGQPDEFVFVEANPRLQVEHTVTEEVLGLDLVRIQFDLAAGRGLKELSLQQSDIGRPRGRAMELRINMETIGSDGIARPESGTISQFSPPGGPGVRIDSFAQAGQQVTSGFDSLLAKLIVSSPDPDFSVLVSRVRRALSEFEIEGVLTNLPFLAALIEHPDVAANRTTTRFIADTISELIPETDACAQHASDIPEIISESGMHLVAAPTTGVVADILVKIGQAVDEGGECLILEAMKMESAVCAPCSGFVQSLLVSQGALVEQGAPLLVIKQADMDGQTKQVSRGLDLSAMSAELDELRELVSGTLDESRPIAVAKRDEKGQRTARANVDDLCDDGSFIEYGQLAVAYQHSRTSMDELRALSPADGFVAGIGTVNARYFGRDRASVAVGAYDGSVLAGTQGHRNHKKATRLFRLARERRLPLVLFAEGGGGRPNEDPVTVVGMGIPSFRALAELCGSVPIVGIASGRCFAGNAALLGLADTIIATENSSIGMAGPAMIEAAGLGACTPDQVGPINLQCGNGVVDIRVADEAEAVTACKQYLSYFQGSLADWEAADPRLLRQVVPGNRQRVYDVRRAGRLIADTGSWLELREAFGQSYVTALIRVEGHPMGLIANNPAFNAGAIDADGADKAARFMRLCDAFGLPLLSLIDTPGIMIGTQAEGTALVRHSSRLFAAAASLTVPIFAVLLRKAYGLGAMAAAGGSFEVPFFTVSWPSGELGGMGLEGAVQLAHKRELAAISDPLERRAFFEQRVAERYKIGKATHAASYLEVDAVIDPAETRTWISRGLEATRKGNIEWNGRFVDTW